MTDSDQLRHLLQRYARAADGRDIVALRALFHPKATVEGARGKQSLGQWLQAMGEPRTYPASMHMIADPLIRIDGDTAELDTYAIVYQIGDRTSRQPDLTLGIRYLDWAVRSQDGWRIRTRRAETLWTR